jgi:hypothetical protein
MQGLPPTSASMGIIPQQWFSCRPTEEMEQEGNILNGRQVSDSWVALEVAHVNNFFSRTMSTNLHPLCHLLLYVDECLRLATCKDFVSKFIVPNESLICY